MKLNNFLLPAFIVTISILSFSWEARASKKQHSLKNASQEYLLFSKEEIQQLDKLKLNVVESYNTFCIDETVPNSYMSCFSKHALADGPYTLNGFTYYLMQMKSINSTEKEKNQDVIASAYSYLKSSTALFSRLDSKHRFLYTVNEKEYEQGSLKKSRDIENSTYEKIKTSFKNAQLRRLSLLKKKIEQRQPASTVTSVKSEDIDNLFNLINAL